MTKEVKRKPGPKAVGGKKIGVNLALTKQTRDMLHELAAEEGISASAWVSRAVLFAAMRKLPMK
jgi:hypothetical protein